MNWVQKAFNWVRTTPKGSQRGSLTNFTIGAPAEWGQPRSTYADTQGYITPERMREIVLKTPTASACVNSILDFSTSVPLVVRHKDHSKTVDAATTQRVQSFLHTPNPQDGWYQFASMLYRDITVLGYGAVEIERTASGGVANLWVVDAGRLRIDYDEHGTILGYTMLDAYGIPIKGTDGVHAWEPQDIIYFERDAQSESMYSLSRIAQLFPSAVLEALMLGFIGARFTDTNIPFGLLNLGELTEDELKEAVSSWNAQVKNTKGASLMLTSSRGKFDYVSFAGQLKDLNADKLLVAVRSQIMSIMGVTVNELGESMDVSKSNGYNLSYTFKKRSIEPLLNTVSRTLTRRLLNEELHLLDVEIFYESIDSRDELLQAQIDDLRLKGGVDSVNQIRNRRGDPSVDGGDEPILIMGVSAVPLSMVQEFASAQLSALKLEVETMQTAIDQSKQQMQQSAQLPVVAAPPIIHGAQLPMKDATPDGVGSSAVKLRLPKVALKPSNLSKRQGPVNTNKEAGAHRDE